MEAIAEDLFNNEKVCNFVCFFQLDIPDNLQSIILFQLCRGDSVLEQVPYEDFLVMASKDEVPTPTYSYYS